MTYIVFNVEQILEENKESRIYDLIPLLTEEKDFRLILDHSKKENYLRIFKRVIKIINDLTMDDFEYAIDKEIDNLHLYFSPLYKQTPDNLIEKLMDKGQYITASEIIGLKSRLPNFVAKRKDLHELLVFLSDFLWPEVTNEILEKIVLTGDVSLIKRAISRFSHLFDINEPTYLASIRSGNPEAFKILSSIDRYVSKKNIDICLEMLPFCGYSENEMAQQKKRVMNAKNITSDALNLILRLNYESMFKIILSDGYLLTTRNISKILKSKNINMIRDMIKFYKFMPNSYQMNIMIGLNNIDIIRDLIKYIPETLSSLLLTSIKLKNNHFVTEILKHNPVINDEVLILAKENNINSLCV